MSDDLTDLGRQGGEAFDVRYDPTSHTVSITGPGMEPDSFAVDPDRDWQRQAVRELAGRGFGVRWNRWEDSHDGSGSVMSAARTSFPDPDAWDQPAEGRGFWADARREPPASDDWERGAASYSAAAASAPDPGPPAGYEPPQYGRVRVYPTYTFPVYQSGVGGIGLDQEITVTDFDKQGRQWAEAEAKRQVTEAMGEPSEDAVGGPWWMGQPVKDTFRWQPLKGTPRSAKPNDGQPEPPPWQPWRGRETDDGTDPGASPTTREAEIMKAAMSGHDGQVPDGVAGRDRMVNAGWLDQDGRVTAAGQQKTRDYVQHAPGYQPERRYEGVLETVDAYTPPDGTGTGTGTAASEPDMRFGADGEWISPDELNRRCDAAEAAGTPYVLQPMQVQQGDRVLDTSNGELGTVSDTTDGGVSVKYDRELTPGHPGSQGVHILQGALATGALQLVPRDSTYASLEDRKPPAEQAERYDQRQAHYAEEHGPGKRGKKGWTAHKRGCRVCQDIDNGGDGVGRRMHVLPPAPMTDEQRERAVRHGTTAPAGGAETYTVRFTFAGDEGAEVTHWRWENALDALHDHVAAWVIPDDGTGVLDTDSFIASIGPYVASLGSVLSRLGEDFGSGETPIAPIVGETLADFAAALEAMAAEAAEVHARWQMNEDNAHDLRRAHGEIPGAHLFNVQPAA